MGNRYDTLGEIPFQDALKAICEFKPFIRVNGFKVKVGSGARIQTFLKGVKCVSPWCDKVGTKFLAQRNAGSRDAWHINLYHENPDGTLVLMTSDHILAKSQGGDNIDPANRQCMCVNCNNKKGSRTYEAFLASRGYGPDGLLLPADSKSRQSGEGSSGNM